MKDFVTKRNIIPVNTFKSNRRSQAIGIVIISFILLMAWQGLSLMYTPVTFPGPAMTMASLLNIIQSKQFLAAVATTSYRLLIGMFLAISIGSILGVCMGFSKKSEVLLEPLVYLVQATPPILYMTLAMIWFGLNGRATIFIIIIGSAPVMVVNIMEGFKNIDPKLIEMGKAFQFSKTKMITEIIIPSLKPYFKTALITVFSFGWKLVVMGEVLSASTGLGAQITHARMNLETNMVFAWGIIVVFLCFLFQKMTSKVFEIKPKRRKVYET